MKAIAYPRACPLSADDALIDHEVATPEPGPRDLLVEVRGVSVNPVDTKVRKGKEPEDGPGILGYDAAGVVTAVGPEVTGFRVGDEVFHAGDITRPGTNAEFHLVDERIAGRKPSSLGFAEAAAMPLTSITAWEILFDSFGLEEGARSGESLLVVGGSGGVGSILIQLAKQVAGLQVIATASRPETRAWAEKMGADHVVDHSRPLDAELKSLGIAPRYVASLTHSGDHFHALVELIRPRGHMVLIDDPDAVDVAAIKPKALTLSWEFMFTRSMFQTDDMDEQRRLLNRVADLLDDGTLQATGREHFGELSVANLRRAHELQESGTAIGKTVLDGFARE